MSGSSDNRQHPRFDTDLELSFYMPYDLQTKVEFHSEEENSQHEGVARNIAAGGLCFRSSCELEKGLQLIIQLILPKSNERIQMTGEVRWCAAIPDSDTPQFDTGVQLKQVDGKDLSETIYFDERYQVIWSEALERILGTFAEQNNIKQGN